MSKIRIKNVQTAQGMVEFALVLPILLLVVLGVFAFGHMFFVYSSVVSASREAARWGAAVGTAGGAGGLPRYQDCGSIRAAAVRIGTFAGVSGNSVAIDYDSGPGSTINSNHCVIGDTGPEVGLGDRIIVTVTVQYRPIVPFIDLPTFPLTATSARTIIKSLPVGEAPTARPLWPSTTTIIDPASTSTTPMTVNVGNPLTITVKTWRDDTTLSPTGDGKVDVHDEAGKNCNPTMFPPDKAGVSCTLIYDKVTSGTAVHNISATYIQNTAQFLGSSDLGYVKVIPAETEITISSPSLTPVVSSTPMSSTLVKGALMEVSFKVSVTKGNNMSTVASPLVGKAEVKLNGSSQCAYNTYTINEGTNDGPVLTCSFTPYLLGLNTISVNFLGTSDGNYLGSNISFQFQLNNTTPVPVTPDLTQTAIAANLTQTAAAGTTPGVTPNTATPVTPAPTTPATSVPAKCPYIKSGSVSFPSGTNSLYFVIVNPEANGNVGNDSTIDKIQVSWPLDNYNVPMTQVRFGTGTSAGCNTGTNCLLYNLTSFPPSATFTSGFNSAVNLLPAVNNAVTEREMLLVFGDTPRSGAYSVLVHFADKDNRNCQVQVNTTR